MSRPRGGYGYHAAAPQHVYFEAADEPPEHSEDFSESESDSPAPNHHVETGALPHRSGFGEMYGRGVTGRKQRYVIAPADYQMYPSSPLVRYHHRPPPYYPIEDREAAPNSTAAIRPQPMYDAYAYRHTASQIYKNSVPASQRIRMRGLQEVGDREDEPKGNVKLLRGGQQFARGNKAARYVNRRGLLTQTSGTPASLVVRRPSAVCVDQGDGAPRLRLRTRVPPQHLQRIPAPKPVRQPRTLAQEQRRQEETQIVDEDDDENDINEEDLDDEEDVEDENQIEEEDDDEAASAEESAVEEEVQQPTAAKSKGQSEELDAMIAKYEREIDHRADAKAKETKTVQEAPPKPPRCTRSRTSVRSLRATRSGRLRPRLPPSLKARKKSAVMAGVEGSSRPDSQCGGRRPEVEVVSTEMLDSLLKDLERQGLVNHQKQTTGDQKEQAGDAGATEEKKDAAQIQDSTPAPKPSDPPRPNTDSAPSAPQEPPPPAEGCRPPCWPAQPALPTPTNSNSWESDAVALELHRSKSYIVNLIDRALSRELGTIPEERPAKTVRSGDLSLELAPASGSSMTSTCAPKSTVEYLLQTQQPVGAVCNAGEEPPYVKQLKKLRWGHLRHIQREMRRLEELEKFLDSCGDPVN